MLILDFEPIHLRNVAT